MTSLRKLKELQREELKELLLNSKNENEIKKLEEALNMQRFTQLDDDIEFLE